MKEKRNKKEGMIREIHKAFFKLLVLFFLISMGQIFIKSVQIYSATKNKNISKKIIETNRKPIERYQQAMEQDRKLRLMENNKETEKEQVTEKYQENLERIHRLMERR